MTLSNAGAPHATFVALIGLFVVVLLIGPSFALLFSLQGRRLLHADDSGTALATGPPGGTQPPAATSGGRRRSSGRPNPRIRAAALGLVAVGAVVRALARRRRDR